MRRFRASPNPEWNLCLDSNMIDDVYGMVFLLMNVNPDLDDEELFTRLVLEKCRSASPSLISDVIRYSETVVSSWSRLNSQTYTDSSSVEYVWVMNPMRKLSAMKINKLFLLHSILLPQIYVAKLRHISHFTKSMDDRLHYLAIYELCCNIWGVSSFDRHTSFYIVESMKFWLSSLATRMREYCFLDLFLPLKRDARRSRVL